MTPDGIARDRAILAAATPPKWYAGDCVVHDAAGTVIADTAVSASKEQRRPTAREQANAFAVCHAVNRLPDYIAEAAEMQQRIEAIETAARDAAAAAKLDPWGMAPAYRDGLQEALRILRGGR